MSEGRTPTRQITSRARALRKAATDAERELWWHLRRKIHVEGSYFRRQIPVGPYFADFACLGCKIVIELDGSQHALSDNAVRDEQRTAYLEASGFRVLRFWNNEVFTNIDSVIDTIAAALNPHPKPLSARERGKLAPSPPCETLTVKMAQ